jgi:hypothetical protein
MGTLQTVVYGTAQTKKKSFINCKSSEDWSDKICLEMVQKIRSTDVLRRRHK